MKVLELELHILSRLINASYPISNYRGFISNTAAVEDLRDMGGEWGERRRQGGARVRVREEKGALWHSYLRE